MINRKITSICILLLFLTTLSSNAQITPRLNKPKKESSPKVINPKALDPKVINPKILNTDPVKLIKKPTLNPELYKNINALKKIDVSDSRDRTDKTTIETTGSGAINSIEISGKEPNLCEPPTTRKLDITTSDFSYFTTSSVPDFIKPGVVINYSSIIDGRNTINTTPRTPLTVYLVNTSAIAGLDNLSVDILNPQNVSGINNALGNLTGKVNSKSIPADMNFEITEINSEKSFQYAITGSYSAGPLLSAKFGVSGGDFSNSYYYLIKFSQNMYNVAVDPNTVSFVNDMPNANQLAYVSDVTYGRKGLMLIKTTKSMSEIKAEMSVKVNYAISKGEISGFLKSVNRDSSSEIRVFFYGGSSSVAARSLQESDMSAGFDKWVFAEAGNGRLALPISYKVKNLKGEQLMLSSVFEQKERNCVPKKDIKLKVTLLDLQCIGGRDGGGNEPDDYAIQQYVVYKANGKEKTFTSRSINVFPNRQNGPVQVPNQKNIFISGDAKHQLHVKQNRNRVGRGNIINNSLVFDISQDEYMDKNAEFKIYTWLKEYSGSNDKVLANNIYTSVKIKEVIDLLLGVTELDEVTTFPDGQIGKGSDGRALFHSFGSGYLMLADIQKLKSKKVLEGPIKLGDGSEKAAAWMTFELLD